MDIEYAIELEDTVRLLADKVHKLEERVARLTQTLVDNDIEPDQDADTDDLDDL